MDLLHPSMVNIHAFLLVLVRITAMITLLPVFGSSNLPVQLKFGLSVILSIILFPLVPGVENLEVPGSFLEYSVLIIRELAVGMAIGFVSTFLFAGLQFAGHIVDTQTGFTFVELIDPFTETPTSVLGQFNTLVFTMFFLLINGHYFLMLAVQKSFLVIPLLQARAPDGALVWHLTNMAGTIFITAFKISAPVFVTLILTSITLGVIARTVPQLNVYFVGLPMTIAIGFGTTIIVLPMLAEVFRKLFQVFILDLWKLLYLMA